MNDSVQVWYGFLEYDDEIKVIDGCPEHGKISYSDGVEDDGFECEAQSVIEVLDKMKSYIIERGITAKRVYNVSLSWDSTESDLVD